MGKASAEASARSRSASTQGPPFAPLGRCKAPDRIRPKLDVPFLTSWGSTFSTLCYSTVIWEESQG